jgi:hypothetical protein
VGAPPPPLDLLELVRGLVAELVEHGVLVDEAPAEADGPPIAHVAAVRDALRHVVSANPDGWVPPAGVEGPDFLAAAGRHRVVSILAAAHSRLALPRRTLDQLVATARHEADGVDALVTDLVEVTDLLAASGVRVLVVEGLALAAQAYGDHAARGSDAHALLVAPGDLEAAYVLLTADGWTPAPGFPRPDQASAWQQLLTEFHDLPLTRAAGTIKLSWQLAAGGPASPAFDELWARRAVVDVAGHKVATLASYDALARATWRSAKQEWTSLRSLLDVWRLLTHEPSWRDRESPLTHEQLVSLGLAVKTFGMLHVVDDETTPHPVPASEAPREG